MRREPVESALRSCKNNNNKISSVLMAVGVINKATMMRRAAERGVGRKDDMEKVIWYGVQRSLFFTSGVLGV